MATKKIVELIDDIDGGPAEETIPFSIDGSHLIIDLNKSNADRLRAALADFVRNARWKGGRHPKKRHAASNGSAAPRIAPKAAERSAPKPAANSGATTAPEHRPTAPKDGARANGGRNGAAPAKPAPVTFVKPEPTRTFVDPSPRSIRQWAKGQGIHVSPYGRVPEHVTALFNAAARGKEATKV